MNWEQGKSKPDAVQPRLFSDFSEDEKIVITILEEEGPLAIDMLCIKSGLPMNKVSPLLLNLEFAGLVKGLPGKVYSPLRVGIKLQILVASRVETRTNGKM